jgi:hypothetical protein
MVASAGGRIVSTGKEMGPLIGDEGRVKEKRGGEWGGADLLVNLSLYQCFLLPLVCLSGQVGI